MESEQRIFVTKQRPVPLETSTVVSKSCACLRFEFFFYRFTKIVKAFLEEHEADEGKQCRG